jgi:alpha-beta hydrolase superfamily lysophospholipase
VTFGGATIEATVSSADGTTIGYPRFGSEPGLVHGSMRGAQDHTEFASRLADTSTVYVIDRRGRGRSGPQGADYGFQRVSEDFAAIMRVFLSHCSALTYSPVSPSMSSRSRSAWPLCRAYSSIRWAST